MLTTASMIRLGKTFGNLMVDLKASNAKLQSRAVRIVAEATGCSRQEASTLLNQAGQDVKLAILMQLSGRSPESARAALARAKGFLRQAIRDTE